MVVHLSISHKLQYKLYEWFIFWVVSYVTVCDCQEVPSVVNMASWCKWNVYYVGSHVMMSIMTGSTWTKNQNTKNEKLSILYIIVYTVKTPVHLVVLSMIGHCLISDISRLLFLRSDNRKSIKRNRTTH
jgi:hypothetical protein